MKLLGKIMSVVGVFLILILLCAFVFNWPIREGLIISFILLSLIIANLGFVIWVFSFSETRRKKLIFWAQLISSILIGFGLAGTYFHFLGARVEIIFGIFIFCFFCGPLLFKNKYGKWKAYTRSKRDAFFLSLFDYVGIISLLLGLLFKFQNWRGGYAMTLIGLIVLAIGIYSGNQKFKKEIIFRKEAENKLKQSFEKIES
jgi:hypothetical protein